MPIYEYQCNNCNSKIERLQKMADLPLVDCPECAEPQLRRLVSASGFRLKGTGWYETDFKTKSQSKLGKEDVVVPAASNEAVSSAGGTSNTSDTSNAGVASNASGAGNAGSGGASSGSKSGNSESNVTASTATAQKPSTSSKAAAATKAT